MSDNVPQDALLKFNLATFGIEEMPHFREQPLITVAWTARQLGLSVYPDQDWAAGLIFAHELADVGEIKAAEQKTWCDIVLYHDAIEQVVTSWNKLAASEDLKALEPNFAKSLLRQVETMIENTYKEICTTQRDLLQFREEVYVTKFGINDYYSVVDGQRLS